VCGARATERGTYSKIEALFELPGLEDVPEQRLLVRCGTDDVEDAPFVETYLEEISSGEIHDLKMVGLVGRCARFSFAAEGEVS